MLPALKSNAAAGYQGPVKIELLKGVGLLLSKKPYFPYPVAYHDEYSALCRSVVTLLINTDIIYINIR